PIPSSPDSEEAIVLMISKAGTSGSSTRPSYSAASSWTRVRDCSMPCSPSTPRDGVPGAPYMATIRRPGKAVIPPPGSSGAVSAPCSAPCQASAGPKLSPSARTPRAGSSPAAARAAVTDSPLRPTSPPGNSVTVPPAASTRATAAARAGSSCAGSTHSVTASGCPFRRTSGSSTSSVDGSSSTTSTSPSRPSIVGPAVLITVRAPSRESSSATGSPVPTSTGRPASAARAGSCCGESSATATATSAESNRALLSATAVPAGSSPGSTVEAGGSGTSTTSTVPSSDVHAPRVPISARAAAPVNVLRETVPSSSPRAPTAHAPLLGRPGPGSRRIAGRGHRVRGARVRGTAARPRVRVRSDRAGHLDRLPVRQLDLDGRLAAAHPVGAEGAGPRRPQGQRGERAALPGHVHRDAGPGAPPELGSLGQQRRLGGQQLDLAAGALQQALRECGHDPEVPVDLERGMGGEEVRVQAAALGAVRGLRRAQVELEQGLDPVRPSQPRPQRRLPHQGPAGRLVPAGLERAGRRLLVARLRDVLAGEEEPQVGDVPVVRLDLLQPVAVPLEDPAVGPDPRPRHQVQGRGGALDHRVLGAAQQRGGVEQLPGVLPQQPAVHAGAFGEAHRGAGRGAPAVLRRGGGEGGQMPVGALVQQAEREGDGIAQRREALPGDLLGAAAAEARQGGQLALEPQPAHRPRRPRGLAAHRLGVPPGVAVVVDHPAVGPVEPVRGLPARLAQHPDVLLERRGGVRHVRAAGGPVVHLEVRVHR